MNLRLTIPALALVLACQTAAPVPSDGDLTSLFDGKSLDGWEVRTGKATYRIENDAIVGKTATEGPNTFLCTARNYANFELLVEVKCDPKLNSGIQIRSHAYEKDTPQASKPERIRKAGTVYGTQVEISANGNAGRVWDEARNTRWLDAGPSEGAKKAYRPGEWNRYRIVALGPRIRTWINDVAIADFEDTQDVDGFIGLQVHSVRKGSGPFEVRWRNIRIRELSLSPEANTRFKSPDVKAFIERWEKEGREIYDKRNAVAEAAGLKPGMSVADIGAGTGLYTRLFAPSVKKVYAVDIAEKFIRHIEATCKERGYSNVEGIVCAQDDAKLPPNSVDLAFICATYHHFEYPTKTLGSVRRALRDGGRLIIIDFNKVEGVSSDWVMNHVRADQATVTREVVASGFRKVGEEKLFKENYFLIFRKK